MKKKTGLIIALIAFIFALIIGLSVLWLSSKFFSSKEPEKISEKGTKTRRVSPNIRNLDLISESESLAVHLPFGNPSEATTENPENYLLINRYMIISYSKSRRVPNWVAWRLTDADIGKMDRVDSFRPDDRIPESWGRVTPFDYTGSGFDRGHLCPSADREGSQAAMDSTFLMTNIAPQTPDLNRGPWEKLESYTRTLVRRNQDVYIIAGTYGEIGRIKNKISIPASFWKILAVLPRGASIDSINANTRVIAVEMPNVRGIKSADWFIYKTTVRDIESKTGYNFFSSLPQNLQDQLETKFDPAID